MCSIKEEVISCSLYHHHHHHPIYEWAWAVDPTWVQCVLGPSRASLNCFAYACRFFFRSMFSYTENCTANYKSNFAHTRKFQKSPGFEPTTLGLTGSRSKQYSENKTVLLCILQVQCFLIDTGSGNLKQLERQGNCFRSYMVTFCENNFGIDILLVKL